MLENTNIMLFEVILIRHRIFALVKLLIGHITFYYKVFNKASDTIAYSVYGLNFGRNLDVTIQPYFWYIWALHEPENRMVIRPLIVEQGPL